MATVLPFQRQPHDAMRLGLASLKEDATIKHPVQSIQSDQQGSAEATNTQMLRDLYGVAVPAKAQIEQQILSRFGRLPGLTSSRLGLESLTGELDEFRYESYLGLPDMTEDVPVDLHSQMESKLHLGGKPLARGFL